MPRAVRPTQRLLFCMRRVVCSNAYFLCFQTSRLHIEKICRSRSSSVLLSTVVLRRPSDAYELELQANEITLLMTRSIEPSSFIKQLAGGQPIAIEQDGWTLDVLAAGESLTIQSPLGDQGTERIALTITP
jgi:hypothetical protein